VSSRRRHTRSKRDWSSDVCSSDLGEHIVLDSPMHQDCRVEVSTINPAIRDEEADGVSWLRLSLRCGYFCLAVLMNYHDGTRREEGPLRDPPLDEHCLSDSPSNGVDRRKPSSVLAGHSSPIRYESVRRDVLIPIAARHSP